MSLLDRKRIAIVTGGSRGVGRSGTERFDYLVNNAGTLNHTAFAKVTEAKLLG
jgi:NAD(P)-dependent dehydrogenase (short-subunit alcohol dehydrogenase family)